VNRRALRKKRLRNRAWALGAALLMSSHGWAMDGSDVPATRPELTATTAAPAVPETKDGVASPARSKIPPPRRFSADLIRGENPSPAPAKSKIPPPRRFVAGAPLRQQAPAAPVLDVSTTPPAQIQAGELQVIPKAESNVGAGPISAPMSQPAEASPVAEQPRSMAPAELVAQPATAAAAVTAPAAQPPVAIAPPDRLITPVEESPAGSIRTEASADPVPAAAIPVPTPAPALLTDPAPANPVADPAPMPQAVQTPAPAVEADPAPATRAAEASALPEPVQVPVPAKVLDAAPLSQAAEAAAMPDAVQSPVPAAPADPVQPSQAAESAPMPEGVSQALRTLSASPVVSSDAAPISQPVATPEASSIPTADLRPQANNEPQRAQQPVDPAPAGDAYASASASQSPVQTQNTPQPDGKKAAQPKNSDGDVEQAGCATCGGYHSSMDGGAFHASLGCANGECIPGRPPCDALDQHSDTFLSAFMANMYSELCCPDPCYQPRWEPAANASFFADYARPRTVTRIRYDNLENMVRPDRNQFFIQQVVQPGGKSNTNRITNPALRNQELYLYQEAAGQLGSFFVEIPYRQINPNFMPSQSGFGDINFGIKSLLYDRELLQLAFQFRTYTPSGNAMNNLGRGNFSLDPSILASLKLAQGTYFQAQVGNWIPLGGNQNLAGGVFYWLMSLNQVIWRPAPTSPLIATLEMDGWSFENGGYTNAINPGRSPQIVTSGGGVSYFNIGPGLRQSICNKVDFGGALTWATSSIHWAQPWFRFEVRFLF
jgi:hypothetical protein